jgi:hypothetical protein
VKTVEGEWIRVRLDDGSERRLALDRLLATDDAGHGLHYRFQGWRPRPRGYRAVMRVLEIDFRGARCSIVVPEWDAEAEVEQPLGVLPPALRNVGAGGSCMANLASPSAAGLGVHSFRSVKVRGASRPATPAHPEEVAAGQRYRRRRDGAEFRILDAEPGSSAVPAWSGKRTVRLKRDRLLARTAEGVGLHYSFLGGGVRESRRQRQAAGLASRRRPTDPVLG